MSIDQLIRIYTINYPLPTEVIKAIKIFMAKRGITRVCNLENKNANWVFVEDIIPMVKSTAQNGIEDFKTFYSHICKKMTSDER